MHVLIRDVHLTWAPRGTVGYLVQDKEGYFRFKPQDPSPDFPWKEGGMYINPDDCKEVSP